MVESCVCKNISIVPLHYHYLQKDTRTNTPLRIVYVETIFQCCFLIQYHINHKSISIMCAYYK